MTSTSIAARCGTLTSPGSLPALKILAAGIPALHSSTTLLYRHNGAFLQSRRQFSSTQRPQIKETFPEVETHSIRKTRPAWEHPMLVQGPPRSWAAFGHLQQRVDQHLRLEKTVTQKNR
jgi:hypothetical protein